MSSVSFVASSSARRAADLAASFLSSLSRDTRFFNLKPRSGDSALARSDSSDLIRPLDSSRSRSLASSCARASLNSDWRSGPGTNARRSAISRVFSSILALALAICSVSSSTTATSDSCLRSDSPARTSAVSSSFSLARIAVSTSCTCAWAVSAARLDSASICRASSTDLRAASSFCLDSATFASSFICASASCSRSELLSRRAAAAASCAALALSASPAVPFSVRLFSRVLASARAFSVASRASAVSLSCALSNSVASPAATSFCAISPRSLDISDRRSLISASSGAVLSSMDRTTGKSLVSSSDLIRSKSPSFSPNKPCRRCTSDHSLSTSVLALVSASTRAASAPWSSEANAWRSARRRLKPSCARTASDLDAALAPWSCARRSSTSTRRSAAAADASEPLRSVSESRSSSADFSALSFSSRRISAARSFSPPYASTEPPLSTTAFCRPTMPLIWALTSRSPHTVRCSWSSRISSASNGLPLTSAAPASLSMATSSLVTAAEASETSAHAPTLSR